MQTRPYKNGTDHLSIIGFGGIVVAGMEQAEANRVAREAFDRGVNYYDVAPSYGDAEERLGPAIEEFRDSIFLACKSAKRTRAESEEELHQSLERLRTDRFDLYQLHGIPNAEEARQCLAPGGALETLVAAKEKGLTRYLGFSAHSAEAAVLLFEAYPFDSVLFPVNYTTYYQAGFGPQIVEAARKRGASCLALKAMAKRPWPEGVERTRPKCWYEPHTNPDDAELALRWTLSQSVVAAIPPGDPELFRWALDFGDRFEPLGEAENSQIRTLARENAPLFTLAA